MYKYEPLCKVCKSPARKIIESKRFREKWGYDRIVAELIKDASTASLSRHFKKHVSPNATDVKKKDVIKFKKDSEAYQEELGGQIAVDNLIDLGLKLSYKGLKDIEAKGEGLDPMIGVQFSKLKHEREKLQVETGVLESMVMKYISGASKSNAIEGEVVDE